MSITIDKTGRVHLQFRYTDKQGTVHPKHFSKPEWTRKKDAKAFQDEFMANIGIGNKKLTVNDLYMHYIKEHKMKLNSAYAYDSVFRLYIKDSIGKLKVSEVNQKEIKKWQKDLLSHVFRNNYLQKIQGMLRTAFQFGVRYEYIERNPFLIENLKVEEEKHVVEHWIPQEFDQFIKCVDNQTFADFFSLLYWTGLRYGEAVALTAKDFDPINGTIKVSKTWDAKNRIATTPKTLNSYRTVVCTRQAQAALTERLQSYASAYGNDEDTIIFGFNTHLSPTTMQHAFERYIKKAGVKKINIHALRHSHVFMLRESGFDAFDIAKRLGHSVDMVNNTYGQFFLDRQKSMIDKMEKMQENATQKQHENIRS